MKLVHPDFFCPIEFEENAVPVLILEDQKIFRDFVEELKNQFQGKEGGWILSDNGKILKLPQLCSIIIDPYSLDVNQKKMLMSIYSGLEKEVNTTELITKWNSVLSSLFQITDGILDSVDYELNYRDNIDIIDFFKFMDIRFYGNPESLVERFIDYCNLNREIMGVQVFILVNIKSYLTDEELNYLYEQAFYKDYYFLLVEHSVSSKKSLYEKLIIIDKDSCLIS